MKLKLMSGLLLFIFLFSFAIAQDNISSEQAYQKIENSASLIEILNQNNFSTNLVNDLLLNAQKALDQLGYAKILRGETNATEQEVNQARIFLSLIDWEDLDYSNVLIYTNEIEKIYDLIFLISDKLSLLEPYLEEEISQKTKDILFQAKIAFQEERYNESEELIEEFKIELEKEEFESTTLFAITNNSKTFFEKNWLEIIVAVIIILIIILILNKKLEKKRLKEKIQRMNAEKISLTSLIKKTQEERFKNNNLSQLVYKIRIERYKTKLNELEHELPVFESRLRKKGGKLSS